MGLSKKEINIIALLVIDSGFFLLEIIVGYAVNSLALVADSFHMLNDIVSLLVALWAVNVAKTREADSKYTYGWQRAEILGALVNAVFLLALCFTIFIEAVQRFVMPQEVSNPKLILIVGTCGLISNIVGLFLFHEHGHSHGGHSHGMDEEESLQHNHAHSHSHGEHTNSNHEDAIQRTPLGGPYDESEHSSISINNPNVSEILPSVVVDRIQRIKSPNPHHHHHDGQGEEEIYSTHETHNHVVKQGSKEENSKSLNMHGVFLHVMGDALGNGGVMATAIFIWKTDYSWRFYSDPLVSLIITVIIFSSALPLCKSASRILLQGTPTTVAFDDVREDILEINGVLSIHDFHIWNLTESMLIASLHVDLSVSPEEFLDIAKTIKQCLHAYGVHSATIQPEFTHYYAKVNKLPKRFSTQNGLPTLGSVNGNGDGHDIHHDPIESTTLLNSSNETHKQYGSNTNSQGDITCIVDAAGDCTSDQCVRK